jgi:septal ring-binding cell division protein DamX
LDFNTTHKLKQLLLLLQQYPGNSLRIPLVLGPVAAGKSALMRQLCRKAPSSWRLSQVVGAPEMNGLGLIRQLALDWMPERSLSKKSELMQGLVELKQRGLLPVVAVDDADRLPQEALRLLLQLRREAGAAGFYPILFADSEQLAELQRMAAGDPLQLLYLSPWTAEEAVALYKQEKGKSPSLGQLNRLLERSAGWPGRLLELLDDPSALNPSWLNLSLGLVLALLVIVGLFFARLPQTQDLLGQFAKPNSAAPSALAEDLTLGLPELEPRPAPQLQPQPAAEPALRQLTPAPRQVKPALRQVKPAPQQVQPTPRQPKPAPAPAPAVAPPPSAPPVASTVASPEQAPPPASVLAPASAPEPAQAPAPAPDQASGPELQDNSWLKRQPAQGFSLQLGYFTRMADLRRFATKHPLDPGQPLAAIKQGQGYLLIYGLFPDQRSATRARLLVPDSLEPERIKLRPVADLKKETGT